MAVTPGFPSNTQNYGTPPSGPAIMELLAEAYERCGHIGVELTSQYLQSGRRSLNLVLSSWANRGPNLFTIELFKDYMPQSVGEYIVPPRVINVLADSVVLRQYQMGNPVSVPPDFTTVEGSPFVTVAGLGATPAAGQYIKVGVAVSVGGLIIDGFYRVLSVPGSGQAVINARCPAAYSVPGTGALWGTGLWGTGVWGGTSEGALWTEGLWGIGDWAGGPAPPVTGGGVVPQFITTPNSNVVTVVFPNNRLFTGQPFVVEVQTSVGGLALLGPYAVTSVIDANTFTIQSPYPAGFADTEFENGGNTLLATQATIQGLTQTAYPVDIVMYPLSRGDWEAIPLKDQQGRPTSFWVDRQISPVIHVWPTPDANGPYELRYRASQQIQDADIANGQCLGVPQRFIEAFVSDLAAKLAVKWSPEKAAGLKTLAAEEWQLASDEDREKVSLFVSGDLSQYYD